MNDKSDNMAGQWHTVDESCDILGVSRRTIQRRIKSGYLQSKLQNGRRYVLVTQERQIRQGVAEMSQVVLIEQLRKENDRLQDQLQQKDQQIESLQKQIEESSERHDTIVLQLTRQLEQGQRLLEYHQSPWWRRWFGRKQTEKR